jgi:hypothetical protein
MHIDNSKHECNHSAATFEIWSRRHCGIGSHFQNNSRIYMKSISVIIFSHILAMPWYWCIFIEIKSQIRFDGCKLKLSLPLYQISQELGLLSQYSVFTTDWATEVLSPAETKDFSSSLCVQTSSGAHLASYPLGTGGHFPGVKRGRGVTLTTNPI